MILNDIFDLVSKMVIGLNRLINRRKADIQIKLISCKRSNGNSIEISNKGYSTAQNVTITIETDDCYWDCSNLNNGKTIELGSIIEGGKLTCVVVNIMVGGGKDVVFNVSWSDKHTKKNTRKIKLHLYSIDCQL